MAIARKYKEEAALNMAIKVFKPKFIEHAEACKTFAIEVYNHLLRDAGEKVIETGVDQSYLKFTGSFQVMFEKPNTDDESKSYRATISEELKWESNNFAASREMEAISLTGYNKVKNVIANLDEPVVVPSGFHGHLKIDLVDNPNDKTLIVLAEKLADLNKSFRVILKEAQKYYSDILSCLEPLNSLKQVEATFPAALSYLPKPAPKAKLPAPVELINNITQQLHAG